MPNIAIVGSGPAGFYAAEAAIKRFGDAVRIDMIDRLPTPFGLIRAGVAPDHQSIKAVSRRYDATASGGQLRYVGGVTLGTDVGIGELLEAYDAVVLATGAPHDRSLGIPGEDLPGVIGSAAFVGWYNGHPDHAGLNPPLDAGAVCVIGNGNVAIDCARVLAKTRAELADSDIAGHALDALAGSAVRSVHLVGRRGPHQVSFTPKELGELGELERATPLVDGADFPPPEADAALEPGLRKVLAHLRGFAARGPDAGKPVRIGFDFFSRPVAVLGEGRAEGLQVERTRVDADGVATGTGELRVIPCGMVIPCIGYRTGPVPDVPFDARGGKFMNRDGRIADRLWCTGWARRGPSGTIGTNRTDAFAVVEAMAAETGEGRPGGAMLDTILAARGVRASGYDGWRRIDAAEVARARPGAPREKFVTLDAMAAAMGG